MLLGQVNWHGVGPTVTVLVEVLLSVPLSAVVVETTATFEISVPSAAPPSTVYVARKVAVSPLFKLRIEQSVDEASVLHVNTGPVNWTKLTTAVLAGVASTR